MEKLTCKMCGSNDLVKQNGMFVCESCGTKYSVEEAKKMIIEGTVKIDNSWELRNLYTLARQAKDSNDAENAVKYYDLIKQKDPGNWEAFFYNVYFRVAQTRVIFIDSAANSIKNCLETVFELIKNSTDSDDEKKIHVAEVALRVKLICSAFEESSKSALVNSWRNFTTNINFDLDIISDYGKRAFATADVLFACGDLIERDYKTDTEMINAACELWEKGIYIWKCSYVIHGDHSTRYKTMKNSYVAKMQKYQSNYSFTKPLYYAFPLEYKDFVKKHSDRDFKTGNPSANTSSASNTTNTSSGGCYVATAVYGSYDCPQVWTLRRYRDYTLAETWHGRAFIKTYYAISPTLVKLFGHTEWFKKMWKGKLDQMVAKLKEDGIEDTPYEDKRW